MIGRYIVSGTLAVLAIAGAYVAGVLSSYSGIAIAGLIVSAPVGLVAVMTTRRLPGGKILFRSRPLDERESELVAATDSLSITLFLIVSAAGMVILLLAVLVAPQMLQDAGGSVLSMALRMRVVTQRVLDSMMAFVLINSVVGVAKFADERK